MKVHCAFFTVIFFCKGKNAGIGILEGELERILNYGEDGRVAVAPPVLWLGGRGSTAGF